MDRVNRTVSGSVHGAALAGRRNIHLIMFRSSWANADRSPTKCVAREFQASTSYLASTTYAGVSGMLSGARGMTVLAAARDAGRGREAERGLRDGGAAARFVQLDVTDEPSVTSAAKLVEAEFGVLDILVNNAGIARGDAAGKPSQTTLATAARGVRDQRVRRGRGDQRDAAAAAPLARRPDRQ